MIVQLLIGDGGKLSLADLPAPIQAQLAHELGEIRLVDRQTVHSVASEFARELGAIGLSAPGGRDAAIDALSAHISPEIAKQLRAELASAKNGDPWTMIEALEEPEILTLMTCQSIEVCAVAISKLPVSTAADVLAKLPGERARRITYAMSQTQEVKPAIVRSIGQALVADHCGNKITAFDKPPDARLGAILNSSPAATREALLDDLDQQDSIFAATVRQKIFTFENISSRVAPLDIPSCIRGVEPEMLTKAIAAALASTGPHAEAAEFILANISQRMASQMREDAAEIGTISETEAEAAMRAVSAEIRALADSGAITLISDEATEGA